ncbi:hypothetical protein EIP91_005005 [Steccherinum ochraceum]|uniref:Metallo-beta-lactamase domain-containing protein n=1 Tax=Steccherinum ochraceum TaxID=92696 RepID=A0A4R0R7S4_9APHY|nr:hypothetical protein EIP91_005005 [Steccherinum ochraceum]
MSKISKIFITHMHADHIMGLITLLRSVLGFPKPEQEVSQDAPASPDEPVAYPLPKVEIYGPRGIRRFLRSILTVTHSRSADKYAAHELLISEEQPSAPVNGTVQEPLHGSEVPGTDFRPDEEGFWRGVVDERMGSGNSNCRVLVDAGPIIHRDPCLGFVVREVPSDTTSITAARTLLILGDTSDPRAIIPLVSKPAVAASTLSSSSSTIPDLASSATEVSTSAVAFSTTIPSRMSLVIHECTDAFIPPHIDTKGRTGKNRRLETVYAKALEKGHSIPAMAGAFAKAVGAEKLVLNHVGTRFPAPPPPHQSHTEWHTYLHACIEEIERQTLETFQPPPPPSRSFHAKSVIVAYDFLTLEIPPYTSHRPAVSRGSQDNNELAQQESDRFKRDHQWEDGSRGGWRGRGKGRGRGREHSGNDSRGESSKKPRR